MTRFGQEKKTDLRDMGAGRDVDMVALPLGLKVISASEVVKCAIGLFKIPRGFDFKRMKLHFCLR